MAVGKNKRLSKGKGKGKSKRAADPFTRKDWYELKAPSTFETRNIGKTLINRSQGLKNAVDGLKHRVFEVSLADLSKTEENAFRKIRLRVEEVQGKTCLTNFWGMDMTSDKLRSLVKKWQSLIEAYVDVKTTDGYVLRLFAIAFTTKARYQVKTTSYAQASQIRAIRKRMFEIMINETSQHDLKEVVKNLQTGIIGTHIMKACKNLYPLKDVLIRKVKVLKTPKFDVTKLLELHGETGGGDVGTKIPKTEFVEKIRAVV